jgi:hypothetical protein
LGSSRPDLRFGSFVALDALASAVVVVDADLRIILASAAAEAPAAGRGG